MPQNNVIYKWESGSKRKIQWSKDKVKENLSPIKDFLPVIEKNRTIYLGRIFLKKWSILFLTHSKRIRIDFYRSDFL